MFNGRTDVEVETPLLWPPDANSWLIWKDPDAGKDWRQEEKRMTEDEMVGWNHWLDGHGFGWTLAIGDGQGGLACCGSWVAKSRTRLRDWTELNCRLTVAILLFPGCFVVPLFLSPFFFFCLSLWVDHFPQHYALIPFFYLLCIYCRLFLCHYHELYIKHLIDKQSILCW